MFVVTAIPSITVIYYNSVTTQKNTEQAIADSAQNKLKANQALGDEMMTNIIYNALDLILAKQYTELDGITSYKKLNSDYKYVNVAIKMKGKLEDLSDRNKLVHSIFYYMDGADYVISTNGGFVKLNQYEDLTWLQDAIPKFRGGEGIWYPRNLTTTSNGQDMSVNVVTYLYRSNSLYTSAKGTIAINVYEHELSDLIYSDAEYDDGEGYLVNGKGDVIAHSNEQDLYKNFADIEYVQQILGSKNNSGYGITDDGRSLYTFVKSELYDWTYVNVYSLEQIYAESRQVTQTGVIMTLLIILGGAMCAVLISLKISKPIRQLTNEIRDLNLSADAKTYKGNEIVYLSGAFGKIREREQSLKESLSQSEDSVRRIGISNLLHGDSLQEKEELLLKDYYPYSHFIVCLLSIDKFRSYQNQTNHEARKEHRQVLYNLLKQAISEEYIADCIRYNVSSVGILINIKHYDSIQVKKDIKTALQKVQKSFATATGYTLTAGISQVHYYFDSIKNCSDEALEALKLRLVKGHEAIVFYQKSEESKTYSYTAFHQEKRIINYVELGDKDKISEELQFMVENMKATAELSVENIMLIFNQLVGATLIYLNKHNDNVVTILGGNRSNLYLALAELETLDEIRDFFCSVYSQIIDFQMTDKSEEHFDYSKTILRYIKQNYHKDIDFEQLSKEIGISYSYARKIVKERTGKSLIDNLNMIRIGQAKILLESDKITIAEISAAVGYNNVQSLYRFFKKYEGISPSDYKASMLDGEDIKDEH